MGHFVWNLIINDNSIQPVLSHAAQKLWDEHLIDITDGYEHNIPKPIYILCKPTKRYKKYQIVKCGFYPKMYSHTSLPIYGYYGNSIYSSSLNRLSFDVFPNCCYSHHFESCRKELDDIIMSLSDNVLEDNDDIINTNASCKFENRLTEKHSCGLFKNPLCSLWWTEDIDEAKTMLNKVNSLPWI